MGKKTTTTHRFYVVDLIRKKPATRWIEIPKYRVDVTIEVTASGVVPEAKLKRLEDAARERLEDYEILAEANSLKGGLVAIKGLVDNIVAAAA